MAFWQRNFLKRLLSAVWNAAFYCCCLALFIYTCVTNKTVLNYSSMWSSWLANFILLIIAGLRDKKEGIELKGREVVLITGCDTGLGYSLACHLCTIGFRVVAAVHNIESTGAHLLLQNHPDKIHVLPLDITIDESVKTFRNAVSKYLHDNDYVLRAFVNNAGVMIFGEFEWQTDEQASHQIEVNVLGTMRLTRAFLPIMRKHSTRMIVVTSHCANEPLPGVSTYGATKAALTAWATSLRVELKKFNIDVVIFIPGSFIAQSNLFAHQRDHFETMAGAMSEEMKKIYGDYFTRYVEYMSKLVPSGLPKLLDNPDVYDTFDSALFQSHPYAVYRSESLRYKIYRIMFKISPTKLRDYLVLKFVSLPSWKPT